MRRRSSVTALALCAAVFVNVAAQQVSEARVGRFGTVGRGLSEEEILQIRGLGNAAGKPPWLILGFGSLIWGVERVTVYLEPTVTTERLQRGRALRLMADTPPLVSRRSPWRVENTEAYAYVPLDGRPREFANEDDLGWPFTVRGEIDDATLVSLVAFVRSRPALPGVPEGAAPREVVSWPIAGIAQHGDQFVASLRHGGAEVFRVTVIKKDGQWVVTKWDWSVA